MSTPPRRSQADIFFLLLKNVWLLGFYLLLVFVFGIAFWAIFGWRGLIGLAGVCFILWQMAGRAAGR